MIWDDAIHAFVAKFNFNSDVVAVKLRRDRVIAILTDEVYEFNFNDLEILQQFKTYPNKTGVACINPEPAAPVLITVGTKMGEIRRTNCLTKETKCIMAHEHSVVQVCITRDGSRFCTASERGTKIRIFDTESGNPVQEFTRGTYGANISSISFDYLGSMVVLTSNTGTAHVFSLSEPHSGAYNYGFGISSLIGNWSTTKSITQLNIQNESISKCRIVQESPTSPIYVTVIGASGIYYKYSYSSSQNSWTQHTVQHFFKGGILV